MLSPIKKNQALRINAAKPFSGYLNKSAIPTLF
jgi:hypothetical protein